MRRLFFFTIIFTSLYATAISQTRFKKDIELIPNIGISASMIFGGGFHEYEPLIEVQYGLLLDYYLSDRWSVRSGISKFIMGSSTPYKERKLSHINLPINANWHFDRNRNWNLNFGLTPGFLTKATIDDMLLLIIITHSIWHFHMGLDTNFSY